MQKFIGDKYFLSVLKIVDGLFYTYLKEGLTLILDEINLASEEVIQCIEDKIDFCLINIGISGNGKMIQEMKERFCSIAIEI